jgi:hypothetical protein
MRKLANELKQHVLSYLDLCSLQSVRLVNHDLKVNALRPFQPYFSTQVLLLIPEKLKKLAQISDHEDFRDQVQNIIVVFGIFQCGVQQQIRSKKQAAAYRRDLNEQFEMQKLGMDVGLMCHALSGLRNCRKLEFRWNLETYNDSHQVPDIRCGGVRRIDPDLFPVEELVGCKRK